MTLIEPIKIKCPKCQKLSNQWKYNTINKRYECLKCQTIETNKETETK